METIVTFLIGLALTLGGPVLYIVLQIRALARWRRGWRIAAFVPLIVMGLAVAFMVSALREGSNIAPIAVVFAALFGVLWLLVFTWAHDRATR